MSEQPGAINKALCDALHRIKTLEDQLAALARAVGLPHICEAPPCPPPLTPDELAAIQATRDPVAVQQELECQPALPPGPPLD